MFVACGIWCLADVSSVSPSSEQSALMKGYNVTLKMSATHNITLLTKGNFTQTIFPCSRTQISTHIWRNIQEVFTPIMLE